MRILITGVSSFTGAWFAIKLAAAGHDVFGTLQGTADRYVDIRAERLVAMRAAGVMLVDGISFGTDAFIELVSSGFDIICHHGANVTNYRSMDFDVAGAVAANTRNSHAVLTSAAQHGCSAIVLTGSVFEQDEGAGECPRRAFSPYGLSKGLTWQSFEYWAAVVGIRLAKFVIPNPFGAMEEPRFCAYLMKTWMKGDTAEVRTPDYVRDNIPVDLLSKSYVEFVSSQRNVAAPTRLNPSGYLESQGAFARRFASEIGRRLGIATPLLLSKQTDFEEPIMRVNTDNVKAGWDETVSWNAMADYYRATYL